MILIFFLGLFSWLASTLAGGGGAMVFVPVSGLFFHIHTIAPVVAIAGMLSGVSRIFLYRKHINLRVSMLVMPGTVVGAVFGAYLFSYVSPAALAIALAGFYILNGTWFFIRKDKKLFSVKDWYFPAGGFISAFMSGIVGVGGPFMNPLYLNYGLKKEMLLGTKAAVVIAMQLFKTGTYAYTGIMSKEIVLTGVIAGAGAITGNYIGRRFIRKISDKTFEAMVNMMLLVCAFIIVFKYFV